MPAPATPLAAPLASPLASPFVTTTPLLLPPGHVHAHCVPADTVVFVIAGRAQLDEPPRWLAECMHVQQVLLQEGQAHSVSERGWLVLQAPADGPAAQVLLLQPETLAARWHRWLATARRRLLAGTPIALTRRLPQR